MRSGLPVLGFADQKSFERWLKALDDNPKASAFFATLNGRNRYAILYRIGNVKKAETRARKIAEFVAMLERRETIHG